VEWSEEVAAFVKRARSRNKIVIFDTDDLIFEPKLDRHFAFLDGEPEAERQSWIATLGRYARTLQACDGAIVTTEPLRDYARKRSARVEVVFNAVSEDMVRLADDALASESSRARKTNGEVNIAYLSGTPTHNRDFMEAADAVLWALETYPQTQFLAVGKLDVDGRFERFGSRVQRIPKQPWGALPELLAQIDISLAPLERDNPFTECKSCVKYLEAGLLGVPTIASTRADFVRAIEHGRNGLLADTPKEWRDSLRELIESPSLRNDIGAHAREDVRRNHTTNALARLLEKALTALVQGDERGERRLAINWLVGARTGEADGVPGSLELASFLAQAGHAVRVYIEPATLQDKRATVLEQHHAPRLEVKTGYGNLSPADVSLATNSTTADVVAEHQHSLFKCYLVSAIEENAKAYDLPVRLICLKRDLADRLAALTGRTVEHIDLGGDDRGGKQLEQILLRTCFVSMTA
jgi:glycosyltransferase involved in cell wall biosynthesis